MKKPGKIQAVTSVAACKLTRLVLRKTGRGGTAIPGIVGLKLSKNILAAVSQGMKIVVVTGTNGKTTTCNMIEHALTSAGHDCLLNKSGANLLHGIASDLICSADWKGKPLHEYAVLECDEAALKQVVPFIRPKVIVVTNLFSDQVDRYGGVQNTLKEIRTGIERSPKSVIALNSEDPLSASLAIDVPNKVVWYGFEETVGTQGKVDLADAGKCPKCGGEYEYDYHIYAHLGGFRCTKCGYHRESPDVAVTSIEKTSTEGSVVRMRPGRKASVKEVRISLPAIYNIYNAAASVAAVIGLRLPAQEAVDGLATVHSSFGRMETFDLNGNRLQMILVKNPAGCNQAFSYVTGFGEDFSAVPCLNDRTGDGHDISWIELTDYEKLVSDPHLKKLYVGGDRAEDLYKRLLTAGASEELLERFQDYGTLVARLKEEKNPVFLLPNYTAMMEMRDALIPETGASDFWQ